mmetsp:Transcript_26280/g.54734  ORF Transcript_26280/g.54734 Transcript_26280/m.54734 type:complete len:189 (+) Transcript_26280:161-727(+)|eukprot:CAMPEP_0197549288 /NCGR_PEP_ID=MMETSP1320-20131121/3222_1 /TAXON_ID=91990 /ORGANISM="Bolidomonas sp., Strain RCC2347" /LENGTH=188 /DNA_ID=CAMNT_0043109489 /DNA_START=160 /DNA_END=726 /DNA_ORIENTATION=+
MPPLPPWLRAWGAARKLIKRESTRVYRNLDLAKSSSKKHVDRARKLGGETLAGTAWRGKETRRRMTETAEAASARLNSTAEAARSRANHTRELAASAAPQVEKAVKSGVKIAVEQAKENVVSAANEIGRVGLRYVVPWTVLLAFAFGLGVSLPGEFRKAVMDWRRGELVATPEEIEESLPLEPDRIEK